MDTRLHAALATVRLFEPAWANGQTLPYFLVDTCFGLRPLGVLASAHPWLLAPSGWLTITFEALFPFVIWWRRARGPLLALGVALHLGIFALMNVGPFSLVALAAYPVLLGQDRSCCRRGRPPFTHQPRKYVRRL